MTDILPSALTTVTIPNRPVFRPRDVGEIAELQPYVLRTWEAEFPDLGVAKSAGGPRVYRRADVERVLRIKHRLFGDMRRHMKAVRQGLEWILGVLSGESMPAAAFVLTPVAASAGAGHGGKTKKTAAPVARAKVAEPAKKVGRRK